MGALQVYEVAPATAFIWYYPFFTVMVLIVINIVVAIIGESYATVKHNRWPGACLFFMINDARK